MNIKLVPGKKLAKVKKDLLAEFMKVHNYLTPRLDIFLVGNNKGSILYVKMKKMMAEDLGIKVNIHRFEDDEELPIIEKRIKESNENPDVTGIMIQAPVGKFSMVETQHLFNTITPRKDVDGLGAINLGYLWQNKYFSDLKAPVLFPNIIERDLELFPDKIDTLLSATPLAILDCLSWTYQTSDVSELATQISGKKILIANRSSIVGKPLAGILLGLGAEINIVHSEAPAEKENISQFDIIITAIGRSDYWHLSDFTEGQVIIDAAITKNSVGDIAGDVIIDYANISKDLVLAGVPGGVGPLTIINLLMNTVAASYLNSKHK